jgi:hypothetical protein
MKPKHRSGPVDAGQQAAIVEKLRRDAEIRLKGYRERALALFPHVCASCGREFSGKRLKELTVHHRDHDHGNNPNDGSNWELLCIYCHDHEHEKYKLAGLVDPSAPAESSPAARIANPFDQLDQLLPGEEEPPKEEVADQDP